MTQKSRQQPKKRKNYPTYHGWTKWKNNHGGNKDRIRMRTAYRNGKAGYVYVISLGFDYLYKVGIAGNFEKRFKALTAANPRAELKVLRRVPNCVYTEAVIHRRFRNKRVEREIFNLSNDELYAIDKLLEKHQKKAKKQEPVTSDEVTI